jgi:hypothetical protein
VVVEKQGTIVATLPAKVNSGNSADKLYWRTLSRHAHPRGITTLIGMLR